MDAFLQGLGETIGTGIGLILGIIVGVAIDIRVKRHEQKQAEKDKIQAFIGELTVDEELVDMKIEDLRKAYTAVSTDFATQNFSGYLNLSEVASDITLDMLRSGRLYHLLDTSTISKLRGAFRLYFSPYADDKYSRMIQEAQYFYEQCRNNNDDATWKDKYRTHYVQQLEFWLSSLQQSKVTFQGVIKTLRKTG